MIREIKYQAWHKEQKKMYRVTALYLGKREQSVSITPFDGDAFDINTIPLADVFLSEFTGLKDRHGNEIYEHDIVVWDGGQYTVIFSEVEGGWLLKDDRDDWECPSLYGVSSPKQSRIVIIGNVYETTELLERSSK